MQPNKNKYMFLKIKIWNDIYNELHDSKLLCYYESKSKLPGLHTLSQAESVCFHRPGPEPLPCSTDLLTHVDTHTSARHVCNWPNALWPSLRVSPLAVCFSPHIPFAVLLSGFPWSVLVPIWQSNQGLGSTRCLPQACLVPQSPSPEPPGHLSYSNLASAFGSH